MNKKQFREEKKNYRQISREASPAPNASVPGHSALPANMEKVINEHRQTAQKIFELATTSTAKELAEISARQNLIARHPPTKLQGFIRRLLGIFGHHQPPPPSVNHLVRSTHEYADRIIADLGSAGFACRRGCSWCCSEKVATSIPEVFYIANYLEDSSPPADLIRLKEDISRAARQIVGMSNSKHRAAHIFCPLLIDGKCSIYAARSLAAAIIRRMNPSARKSITTG